MTSVPKLQMLHLKINLLMNHDIMDIMIMKYKQTEKKFHNIHKFAKTYCP